MSEENPIVKEALGDDGTLKGWIPDMDDKAVLLEALEQALDYRGDVTIATKDGTTIDGYIFDKSTGQGLEDSYLRIMPKDSLDKIKVKVFYSDLARLEFSGKDAAHGKTWENWLRRWAEKKLKGEEASIESEALDKE